MRKTVGIIAAKSNSGRFPGKNIYEIDGIPMFWYSVIPLLESELVESVYVTTDSEIIKKYCEERHVGVIWRNRNAIYNEEPLLKVLNFAYKNINTKYENIITIMANCPHHTKNEVNEALKMMESNELKEVISFDNCNHESGLRVFDEQIILQTHQVSSYVGCIKSNAKEIHYISEL